jgi:hypothetical protein
MRARVHKVRLAALAAVLVAAGGLTVTFVSGGGKDSADAATSLSQYVPIEQVSPQAAAPRTGRFTVDCGTNGNRKFSPDNPVAQPGIKNGAEHLHDFVGNRAITATSSDAELAASGTTCRNGDRSSYFWPVVRIDRAVRPSGDEVRQALAATSGTVVCPSLRDRLPAGARGKAERILSDLDRAEVAADRRILAARGVNPGLNAEVLRDLRNRRSSALAAIGAPAGMVSLVDCDISYDGVHATLHARHQPSAAPSATPSALPSPQGPRLELPGNTGGIVRPRSVLIEYRGNPGGKVVAMPRFLRALTGDAKPTSRGPANARASWTCSGFADRVSDRYPICPAKSLVQRVHDFPGCWDGKNIDSANHRAHVAFADRATGACPQGFVAIPQLRITISYAIPREVQIKGQYALDSFPEENHNPFSDHDDFVNVNSVHTMQRIVRRLNQGR